MCIVRHKKTNLLYKYLGGSIYENIITGVKGDVPDEIAQNIFAINLNATEMIDKYPQVENLIKSCNLKISISNEQ